MLIVSQALMRLDIVCVDTLTKEAVDQAYYGQPVPIQDPVASDVCQGNHCNANLPVTCMTGQGTETLTHRLSSEHLTC